MPLGTPSLNARRAAPPLTPPVASQSGGATKERSSAPDVKNPSASKALSTAAGEGTGAGAGGGAARAATVASSSTAMGLVMIQGTVQPGT